MYLFCEKFILNMDILNIGYSNASERYFSTLAGVFFNFCDTFGPLDNQALANIPSNPSDQFLRRAGFSLVVRYLFQHLSSSNCFYGCSFCQAVHLNPVPVHCTRTCPYSSRHFRRSAGHLIVRHTTSFPMDFTPSNLCQSILRVICFTVFCQSVPTIPPLSASERTYYIYCELTFTLTITLPGGDY